MPDLAPCPYCASHEIHITRRTRLIRCGNCHVEVRPPAWCRVTEAEAAIFWNRSRRPALYLVSGEGK
jgi:ribosomal protein L37AE/L43A